MLLGIGLMVCAMLILALMAVAGAAVAQPSAAQFRPTNRRFRRDGGIE
jgi:hypothetical protein